MYIVMYIVSCIFFVTCTPNNQKKLETIQFIMMQAMFEIFCSDIAQGSFNLNHQAKYAKINSWARLFKGQLALTLG